MKKLRGLVSTQCQVSRKDVAKLKGLVLTHPQARKSDVRKLKGPVSTHSHAPVKKSGLGQNHELEVTQNV